ncbi:MAG: serine kinase [Candidatus Nanoarchaeia archaeon]
MDEALSENEISSLYCGDLLSDVMAHIKPGAAWFTIQGHLNSIAVAQLKDVTCIVLVNGVQPEKQALEKAKAQGIVLLGSPLSSAELCMKMAGQL